MFLYNYVTGYVCVAQPRFHTRVNEWDRVC